MGKGQIRRYKVTAYISVETANRAIEPLSKTTGLELAREHCSQLTGQRTWLGCYLHARVTSMRGVREFAATVEERG